ncbi:PREDICTED: mRNAional regulator ATRX [Prunus dulcis]|uniref:PREDICTED: mRNAional regulator ATRX n=1 Tax=Prunus dulcis TaxID=3755 RepID=A0A5E4ELV9_PRUDU|nr:G patch domain-containing protein 8 [Prunus dulcis]VVA16673.1 PREDICTED: mRNAional regulator ATRX [Prunus dulcis]
MGKSSSSHRKKRAKISSQAGTRKSSKSKPKSRKYRSKKLRRRDDSPSHSDDGDSRSLESVSSFSSDDDSRSRRARSRTRRDLKGSKKKARRRSHSHDSSEDSPRGKKRKSAKKKNDYEARKKSRSRKKPRRNASISSRSSASFSCSTCPSGSICGDEIESKRHRGRPGKRNRDESDINKVESGTKRARYRSRSCSSHSQCSERGGDSQSEEKVTFENKLRRLRSVITVTEEDKHGRWMDKDGHKEEMAYDDDYPSCRSNDSNDGGCKRELDNHLHVVEKRIGVESGKEEKALISNVPIEDLTDSGNIFEKDYGGQDDGINSSRDGIGIAGPVNENTKEVSGAISRLPGEDLESILRQRALENLKRFKGSHQRIPAVTTSEENKSNSDLKQPSTVKADFVQIESPKESGARAVVAKSSKEGATEMVVAKSSKEDAAEMVDTTQLLENANGPPVRDPIVSSKNLKKELDRTSGSNELQDVACPTYQVALGNSDKKVDTIAVLNKPNLASPKLRCHSAKAHSTRKQAAGSQEPPHERLLVIESSADKSTYETAQTVPQTQSTYSNGDDINDDCGCTAPEPSGENRSDKQQGEGKDGSQFEQKTMSVMRGSEMVQVSYKVYIPKKAPGLARRQLRR